MLYLLSALKLVYFKLEHVQVHRVLYLLTLFNAFLDPFIYAVRMREIQRGLFYVFDNNKC